MHIAFAASECVPFSKTGGLADVVEPCPAPSPLSDIKSASTSRVIAKPNSRIRKLSSAASPFPSTTSTASARS